MLPLVEPLKLGRVPPDSALGDVCIQFAGCTALGERLAGGEGALIAALIASGAVLNGGPSVEERLLEEGTVDLSGARAVVLPTSQTATAWSGRAAGAALGLRAVEGRITDAVAVIAGSAPYPFRARQTEGTLRGRSGSSRLIELAAETARIEAQPFGVGDLLDEAELERLVQHVRRAIGLALYRGAALELG